MVINRNGIYIIVSLSLLVLVLNFFVVFQKAQELKMDEPYEVKLFSKNEREDFSKKLLQVLDDHDARQAILFLKKEITKDSRVNNSCHEFLHELGKAAYKKYGDFTEAIKYNDEFCVSGFTHGVIQAHFKSSKNLLTTLQTTCKDYPEGKHITWQCNHGLGHGLMYFTGNNLPESIKYCKLLSSDSQRSACANGAYMENFNSDHVMHPSKFVDNKNFFYPCDTLPDYKRDCYVNAPIRFLDRNNYDFEKAFDWCGVAPEVEFRSFCYRGLASKMTKFNMGKPKLVEIICIRKSPKMISDCIGGIVFWYIGYYGDLEQARDLCNVFNSNNKQICEAYIGFQEELFNEG